MIGGRALPLVAGRHLSQPLIGEELEDLGQDSPEGPGGVDSETGALGEDGSLQSLGQTGVLWGWANLGFVARAVEL